MALNKLDETRDNTHERQVIKDTAASFFVGEGRVQTPFNNNIKLTSSQAERILL